MPELGMFDTPMDKFLLRLLEKYGHIPRTPGQAIVPTQPPPSGIPGYGTPQLPPKLPPVPRLGPGQPPPMRPPGQFSGLGGSIGRLGGWGTVAAMAAQSLTEEGGLLADAFEKTDIFDEPLLGDPDWEKQQALDLGYAPQSEYDRESRQKAGLVPQEPAKALQQTAEAVRAYKEAERQALQAEEAAKTKRMQDDAMQRSLDPLAWAGGGGQGSGKQYPADKLFAIREQAKAMGGGRGISVPGGSFSQMTDDPAARARIADMNEWTDKQPERNLEFAMTPEQAKMNPQYAATAADSLKGLRNAKTAERQVANQEALIEAVRGTGGKVPFELANQLDVAGFEIPWPMRGMSADQANAWLDQQDQAIVKDIEDLMGGGPEHVTGWAIYARSVFATARKRIAAGEDADRVIDWQRSRCKKAVMRAEPRNTPSRCWRRKRLNNVHT